MKILQLTGKGGEVLLDNDDYERIKHWKWYNAKGYAVRTKSTTNKNYTIRLHRFILGVTDPSLEIDHINGNTLDNRKSNLRVVEHKNNTKNTGINKRNTSGFKGVTWNKASKKWIAQIQVDRVKLTLGRFDVAEEAAAAYNAAAAQYFGEYCRK